MKELENVLQSANEFKNNINTVHTIIESIISDRIKYYIAVDYSVIHSYMNPNLSLLFSPVEHLRSKEIVRFISRRFVFNIYPKLNEYFEELNSHNIILLPPYIEEWKEAKSKELRRSNFSNKYSENEKKFTQSIYNILNNKQIFSVLKNNIIPKKQLLDFSKLTDDLDQIILFLLQRKSNLAGTFKDLDVFSWNKSIEYIPIEKIDIDNVDYIFKKLCRVRSQSTPRTSSLVDATAIEMIRLYNQKNFHNNVRVLFLTDTEPVCHMCNEVIEESTDIDNLNVPIGINLDMLHPLMLCLSDDLHYTKEKLQILEKKFNTLISEYSEIYSKIKVNLSEIDRKEIDDYTHTINANIYNDIVNYKKWAMYEKYAFNPTHIGSLNIADMLKATVIDTNDLDATIIDSYYKLCDFLKSNDISTVKKYYINEVEEEMEGPMFLGVLNLKFNSVMDNYFFDRSPAYDKDISMLITDLKSNDQSKRFAATHKIDELRKEGNFEAILVAYYLLEKLGYVEIEPINECINYIESNIQDQKRYKFLLIKFKFLKTILISRMGTAHLIKASDYAMEILNEYKEISPRLWIHAGYLKFRLFESFPELDSYNVLSEAIELEKHAQKISENDDGLKKCFAISTANLALFNLYKDINFKSDNVLFQTTENYINTLNNFIKNNLNEVEDIPFYVYTRSFFIFNKLKYRIKLNLSEKELMRICNEFEENLKILRFNKKFLSNYTKNKYKILEDKYYKLKKKIYLNINNSKIAEQVRSADGDNVGGLDG